jgi:hypothetical protein
MDRIIRRSATAIAAVTLGLGALTTSFAGAAEAAHCPKSSCPSHPNWIPGNNDPRAIPGNNDPRAIPGNNDPRAFGNPGGPLPRQRLARKSYRKSGFYRAPY